ncbi:hypothetical protein SAMN02745194_01269 [Roseomonas rosea]|uniref:KTSC domain-containing protein n=1 Tax=Muricoccus roseus TaxID=198092 RepID=A0A1M6ETA4_9PROT|nr:hypothetical protein [Roseomonas rosea]SHI88638.1 hypothetical protein SAMN02745194_01269 [Roseomonas rosea]
MGRAGVFGVSLTLLAAAAALPASAAETCSSSTLVSPAFSVARWCGVPPGAGTLRMARRDGGSEEFRGVPLDSYREVIRTPNVARYVAEELEPRFPRAAGPSVAPRPRLAPPAPARVAAPLPAPRPAALRAAAASPARPVAVPVLHPERRPLRVRGTAREACATAAARREARCRG